jgi:hypothetical protein
MRIRRTFSPQRTCITTSAPLNTRQFLQRFRSRRNAFSGIAHGFFCPSSSGTDAATDAVVTTTSGGWIQANPAGVAVTRSIDVPCSVGRRDRIS